jgi:hypothetical protein
MSDLYVFAGYIGVTGVLGAIYTMMEMSSNNYELDTTTEYILSSWSLCSCIGASLIVYAFQMYTLFGTTSNVVMASMMACILLIVSIIMIFMV